jgi:hypothetical protein
MNLQYSHGRRYPDFKFRQSRLLNITAHCRVTLNIITSTLTQPPIWAEASIIALCIDAMSLLKTLGRAVALMEGRRGAETEWPADSRSFALGDQWLRRWYAP